MTARAIIYPGSFGDPSLPKIGLTYTQPLAGAVYDFDSDTLPLGALSQWPSSVDGAVLSSDGTPPSVIVSGVGKAVAFDGITSRMRNTFTYSTAYTLLAVYRLVTNQPADTIIFGYSSANEGIITAGGDGTALYAASGGTSLYPSPDILTDTSWHVAILTVNGANSAFRIDNSEVLGTLPIATRAGLNLGFRNSSNSRSKIEYKRVAMLAGGTTGWQRNSLVAQMRQQYGI